jgi:3-oxoacyl-[acyl-carrier-protein] synthase III
MESFIVNKHGRVVLPSNFDPALDFSVLRSLDQLSEVIRRDFEAKAPTGTQILRRIEDGGYANRYELLRDLALNLFWANRYAMSMYQKRPTRWRDVARTRGDVFLPVLDAWEEGDRKVAAVENLFPTLPAAWDAAVEDDLFRLVFDVFRHRKHQGTELPAVKPTVGEALAQPHNRTWRLGDYDPDFPVFTFEQILDCAEDVAELEALRRWAMVLHNEYPWERSQTELVEVGDLRDDDYVVLFYPRDREVARFLQRVKAGRMTSLPLRKVPETRRPVSPYPAVDVRRLFRIQPRLEALAVVKGEQTVTNDDVVRNSAYNWSPMSAEEIRLKTGVEQRQYTVRSLEELALRAAEQAMTKSGRSPEEIGAVLLCTCTSTRLIPATATWISGELGIYQTHSSCDIAAACAGFAYGLLEATRLLQEVNRPIIVVYAEKFSDKIGTVRPSRMLLADGAAAVVVAPAARAEVGDLEYLQSYASGPVSEVNSIIWPNPDFDNSMTIYGPEVKSLAGRYVAQMIEELHRLPDPDGAGGTLLDRIGLVVPHQANKTMVIDLMGKAGITPDRLYFNIERTGNTSSASIPLALYDAVQDGVVTEPVRVFAPGFGAGAVGGYAVMRFDPRIVAVEDPRAGDWHAGLLNPDGTDQSGHSSEDVRIGFAE